MNVRFRGMAAVLLIAFAVAGCEGPVFRLTPHERYARALRQAGLDDTALGRDWLAAAESVLIRPGPTALPLDTRIEVPADAAWAVGFRLPLRRGQRLRVEVDLPPGDSTRVFVDVFRVEADSARSTERLASAPEERLVLEHEARRDGPIVLRVQCELMRGPRLRIRAEAGPTLAFPVEGRDRRAVLSRFGEPRDGGRRVHQGIDIQAPRGTPALAATSGWVTNAGTNRLGGNVVWLFDPGRGLHLYYAHLDRHAVSTGARVTPGDTIGLVGSTGNAEGTVPHLHFGIYARGEGPLDPHPFVVPARRRPGS
jgi:murein DD-endopeptidase MepM/ murein hydrolase activator NlpD